MSLIDKFDTGDVVENRYHLDIKVHEGRWGDIYRATDRLNDRPVAVRFFPIGEDGPEDLDRFEAHARELSGMTAPTIVTPSDHGVHEEIPYLVYRWAAGENLQDRLAERGRLDRKSTLLVVEHLLKGLDRAHDSRLTHGLIRPVKIIVDELDGDDPLVKLVDFQIWRFYEWTRGEDAFDEGNLSRRIVRYTSPEVLEDHRVKPSSDVYAVGLVAIELLTGQPAFDDNNRVALIARQLSDETATLGDGVDAGETLRSFLDQLISKDEKVRFRTAGKALEFLQDNKSAMLSEPASSGAPEEAEPSEPEETSEPSEPDLEQPAGDDSDDSAAFADGPDQFDPDDELFEGDPSSMQSLSDGDSFGDDDSFGDGDSFGGNDELELDLGDDDEELFDDDEPLFDEDNEFGKYLGDDDEISEDDVVLDEETDGPGPRPSAIPLETAGNASDPVDDDEQDYDPSIADTISTGKNENPLGTPTDPRSSQHQDRPASSRGPGQQPRPTGGSPEADGDISLPIAAALAVGMLVLIVGAIGFIALSGDDPDGTSAAETTQADQQDDEPQVYVMEIQTSPPAQRVRTSRGDEGMSPLEIELTDDQFPLEIWARMDADNQKERIIEEPIDEVHFDFDD